MNYLFIGIICFAAWIYVLITHLRRTDCSDNDKLIWTVVLCTLNLLGVLLYFCLGPSSETQRVLSEQELKDRFNKSA